MWTNWNIKFAKNDLERRKGIMTASIDRIDSDKGYYIGNIHWVHKAINKIKWDYTEPYFIELCEAVSLWQKKKKLLLQEQVGFWGLP